MPVILTESEKLRDNLIKGPEIKYKRIETAKRNQPVSREVFLEIRVLPGGGIARRYGCRTPSDREQRS